LKLLTCLYSLIVWSFCIPAELHAQNIPVKDSIELISDSLKLEYAKINPGYAENLHLTSLQSEILKKQQSRADLEKKLHSSSNMTADSLQFFTDYVKEQTGKLLSLENTLNNYKHGLNSTHQRLLSYLQNKNLENESFSGLKNQAATVAQDLQLKLDSLAYAQRLVSSNLEGYKKIESDLAQQQVSEESVSSSGTSVKKSIWNASADMDKEKIITKFKKNYQENESVNNYINHTAWTNRILLILLSIAYLYWIISTRNILDKEKYKDVEQKKNLPLGNLLAKGMIFFFTLLPLVSFATPSIIIQASQLLLIVIFCFQLRRILTTVQTRLIVILLFFYVSIVLVNSVVSGDLLFRIICIVFNLIAIYIGLDLRRKIKDAQTAGYINNTIFIIFTAVNSIAILLNILGYVDTSRTFSIAGAVGLVQSFTLRFFIEMINHDIKNQFLRNKLTKGFFSRFDEQRALKSVGELLYFICVLLAIIVFASNLQVLEKLVSFVSQFFSDTHSIGGIQFNFGNLFVAIIVLSLANWFQKNLHVLLIGAEISSNNRKNEERMTLFPLFRLIIFVVGFFMAISALGVSLSKLTVIIGALSVGVGLGLQNIINNFVSGIILVFDKPFRVGDQIELADKKGVVKEIGIRASVLKAGDGSEVIIPNGDLLSGRVVNWTLSHKYGKTTFVIQVDRRADLKQVNDWISSFIKGNANAKSDMDVSITVQDISAEMYYLSVTCWIKKVGESAGLKSELFLYLSQKLEAEGLKFFSIAPVNIKT